jgi:hypothetical protein
MLSPKLVIKINSASLTDEKAREIGMIIDLWADLPKEEAQILSEQMELRYFTPVITRIIDVKEEYGFAYFNVVTDFGACKFTIHMGGGSVVHLTEDRIMVMDLDGNRYEIPDVNELAPGELKKLDLFL